MVGFNYVIEMVPDKKYGALDPETGEWNGVVRQILEKVKQNSNSVESSV
jgi:ionotropic kainate glutamate receptor 2